jgi:hypothetical protein
LLRGNFYVADSLLGKISSDVVEEFAALLKEHRIERVQGDRYAGLWVMEQFSANGIWYEASELTKSEIYGELLPLLNSHTVALLNHDRLRRQLLGLERRQPPKTRRSQW